MRNFTTEQIADVMELVQKGWRTPKIASHLDMSNDDVNFIRKKPQFAVGIAVGNTKRNLEKMIEPEVNKLDQSALEAKKVAEFIQQRYSWLNEPVKVKSKEEMRLKILNAPLRSYIKMYATAIHVHGMDLNDLREHFGLQKSSARSMMWQVQTDLQLHNLI